VRSGEKINYDIRPGKSAERRMLCDLLHLLQANTKFFSPQQYVGMGSKYFNDFLLMHNEFGFSDMISIEGDEESINRYEFNKPLNCIEIKSGMTSAVLPSIEWDQTNPSVVWLDYDGWIEKYMIEDTKDLIRLLKPGSVFFISINPSISENELRVEQDEVIGDDVKRIVTRISRVKWLRDRVEEYFTNDINEKMLAGQEKANTIKKIFDDAMEEAIVAMNILEGKQLSYRQLLFVKYQDGADMLTFGGIILDQNMVNELDLANMSEKRDFIIESKDEKPWTIKIPRLTYKEVQAILKVMPLSEGDSHDLSEHGIPIEEVENFSKLYRYYPHFVQALVTS